MKALLLAGGYGSRLRPVTNTIPKCLVEIKGKPLLQYWLEIVFEQFGCDAAIINTHYLADKVQEFIGNSVYRSRIKLVHEPELLGTLNTIRQNRTSLDDAEILIAHADNFCITQWSSFMAVFRDREDKTHITMMTFDTDSPHSCGMVEIDSLGRITAYAEKPEYDYSGSRANGAVFLMDRNALHSICRAPDSADDLCKDFIPNYIEHINCYHNENVHVDIGTPQKLVLTNEMKLSF